VSAYKYRPDDEGEDDKFEQRISDSASQERIRNNPRTKIAVNAHMPSMKRTAKVTKSPKLCSKSNFEIPTM
jgi:hypothetical protein